jgi:hypothetical protein
VTTADTSGVRAPVVLPHSLVERAGNDLVEAGETISRLNGEPAEQAEELARLKGELARVRETLRHADAESARDDASDAVLTALALIGGASLLILALWLLGRLAVAIGGAL